jgi:fucose permease
VARAVDVALLAVSGWYVPPGGSWLVELALLATASGNRIIQNTAADNKAPLFMGSGQMGTFDGQFVLTTNATAGGAIAKGASTWQAPTTGRVCLNGGAIATSAAMSIGFPTIGPVALFGSATTSTQTSGWLRRVQYWPRVLSDSEMQAVTT